MSIFDFLVPHEALLGMPDFESEARKFPCPIPDSLFWFWRNCSGKGICNLFGFDLVVRHGKGTGDEHLDVCAGFELPSLMCPEADSVFELTKVLMYDLPDWKGKVLAIPISVYRPTVYCVCVDGHAGIVGDVYELNYDYLRDYPNGLDRFGTMEEFCNACEIDWETNDENWATSKAGEKEPPLFRAIRRNQAKEVDKLLPGWNFESQYRGKSVLEYAIMFEWPDVVARIASATKDIGALRFDSVRGGGALHLAGYCCGKTFQTLVDHGCDVNTLDNDGNPPWLMKSQGFESSAMVIVCLSVLAGARWDLKNSDGQTLKTYLEAIIDRKNLVGVERATVEAARFTYGFAKERGFIR